MWSFDQDSRGIRCDFPASNAAVPRSATPCKVLSEIIDHSASAGPVNGNRKASGPRYPPARISARLPGCWWPRRRIIWLSGFLIRFIAVWGRFVRPVWRLGGHSQSA
jgi:hypothetical protein